ncbi:hypothetical protein [Sodalis-like endosymbiont of Proechinophthirus fluctus]|nr:hypothetical protein [Sodalis-like endosymbiont of Proechinophthirus fluctus]
MVDVAPQQDFSVRSLNLEKLIELTEQRIIFEIIAVGKSIETRDVEW